MPESPRTPPGAKFRVMWDHMVAQAETTLRENPRDAAAHVTLSEALTTLWCYGFVSRDEALPKAKAAATRALELDDSFAAAHTALGVLTLADWDWAAAERAFLAALERNPNAAASQHWYGMYLAAMGRHEEALAASRRAVALDPSFRVGLGAVLYFAHDFGTMAQVMEEAIDAAPESAPAHDWLGMAYVQLERFDDSIRVYRRAVTLADGAAEVRAGLGHAYGLAGRIDEARAELETLRTQARETYVPPVQIAYVCVGLGDTMGAFALLEQAWREKSWELVFLREEPWFDPLHGDPRFETLLQRMQFPE